MAQVRIGTLVPNVSSTQGLQAPGGPEHRARAGVGEHSPPEETTEGQWGRSCWGPAVRSPSPQPSLPSLSGTGTPSLSKDCPRLPGLALPTYKAGAPGIFYLNRSCPLARTHGCRGAKSPRSSSSAYPVPLQPHSPAEGSPRRPVRVLSGCSSLPGRRRYTYPLWKPYLLDTGTCSVSFRIPLSAGGGLPSLVVKFRDLECP